MYEYVCLDANSSQLSKQYFDSILSAVQYFVSCRLVNVLLNCINLLRPHWDCFEYQRLDEAENAVKLDTSDPRYRFETVN